MLRQIALATVLSGLIFATPALADKDANTAIAMQFYDAYNDRDLIPGLADIFAPSYVGTVNGQEVASGEVAQQFMYAFLDAFPDAVYVIEDVISEGDRVVVRWSCQGSHQGEFAGLAPTEAEFDITGITIFQIENGQILRLWNNWDTATLMQQLQS